MTDKTIDLDRRRGMEAQKATDLRRLLAEVEVNERSLRLRQDELEAHLAGARHNCSRTAASGQPIDTASPLGLTALRCCALWHRASPELCDETDDAEYGRDAHTPSEQGRPGCSAPVVGMGAPRDVNPERGEYNDASGRSGYGRPKKPVHGLPLNTAQVPLVCRSDGPTLALPPKKPLSKGKPPA